MKPRSMVELASLSPTVTEVFDYAIARMSRVDEGNISVTTTPARADVFVDVV